MRTGFSEKPEGPLNEVLMELEHAAVTGVGIDDELAVRESPIEVDGVLGGHHLVALTVEDEHGLVESKQERKPPTPSGHAHTRFPAAQSSFRKN
jgi:hypothetical protein